MIKELCMRSKNKKGAGGALGLWARLAASLAYAYEDASDEKIEEWEAGGPGGQDREWACDESPMGAYQPDGSGCEGDIKGVVERWPGICLPYCDTCPGWNRTRKPGQLFYCRCLLLGNNEHDLFWLAANPYDDLE